MLYLLLVVLISAVSPLASELCDDNPLANSGVKITSQASISCLKGQTPDMKIVGACKDNESFDIQLPFPFTYFNKTYNGSVFVSSNSFLSFGGIDTSKQDFGPNAPSRPSLLIGARDNAAKYVSVGPDPLGWRVRFEGWMLAVPLVCGRDTDIVWELTLLFNSTLQLCTSSLLNNIDPALVPGAVDAVSNPVSSTFATFVLAPVTLYTFTFGTFPCQLFVSLSPPLSSVTGAILMARFPRGVNFASDDFATLTITLHGTGFASSANASVELVVQPPKNQSLGLGSIARIGNVFAVLEVSLQGVANCSLVSVMLHTVTTPFLPQSSFQNISFAVTKRSGAVIYRSDSGYLVAILQPVMIPAKFPQVVLMNNAIRSTSTMSILFGDTAIGSSFSPSALVITLVGTRWSVTGHGQGTIISPNTGKFEAASISSNGVMTINFTSVSSISASLPLHVILYNVSTVSITQPAFFNLRSAILNNKGSILASGRNGTFNAVVSSTMGDRSPTVTFSPPVVSSLSASIAVSLTPNPQTLNLNQHPQTIDLPARIIVTLMGSGFACGTDTAVTFLSPFDKAKGTSNTTSFTSTSVISVSITSGTFFCGYPIRLHFGPCKTPNLIHPPFSNLSAAMIDRNGITIAASSSGAQIGIVEEMGTDLPSVFLADNVLVVTIAPLFALPVNSFLIISLTGVGLVFNDGSKLMFNQFASHTSGNAHITGNALGSVLTATFSTSVPPGKNSFSIFPVYGGHTTSSKNLTAAVCDESGTVKAVGSYVSFTATAAPLTVTVKQIIDAAANGFIAIPEGTYAGKHNCNNNINETVPSRLAGTVVVMKGTSGRSVIDCSGTGMRCLIVQASSVNIAGIVFKGGVSPIFMSENIMKATKEVFDSQSANFGDPESRSIKTSSFSNRRLLDEDSRHSYSDDVYGQHQFSNSNMKHDRHLLQSSSQNNALFHVNSDQAGGCILVIAPFSAVTIFGVSLIKCSSQYGGGIFLNVSASIIGESKIIGNVAQQGGGIFVAASQSCVLELVDFLNNTVVSTLTSKFQYDNIFGVFSGIPDSAAAAGGGAWVQLLNAMINCTFSDNLALAASSVPWVGGLGALPSAHALGGAIYIHQTSSGSTTSHTMFSRNSILCVGINCIAAGTMFVAVSRVNTSFFSLNFSFCRTVAAGTSSEFASTAAKWQGFAMGVCIFVVDASEGLLKIENVLSLHCTVKSVGRINGGCMCFQKNLFKATLSGIYVTDFYAFSYDTVRGIVLAAAKMINTSVSNVVVQTTNATSENFYLNALIFSSSLTNTSFLNISATDIQLRGGENVYALFLISSSEGNVLFSNISTQNLAAYSSNGYCGASVIYLNSIAGDLLIREIMVNNISQTCGGTANSFCTAGAVIGITRALQGSRFTIRQIKVQNVMSLCEGYKCNAWGLVDGSIVDGSILWADLSFKNIIIRCRGSQCNVRGGCMFLNAHAGSISNIQLYNVTVDADGDGSFAAASFLFIIFNNPFLAFDIFNITTVNTMVLSSGDLSAAVGGVIMASYGNFAIRNSDFSSSTVSCSGSQCQSVGGFCAFISSLGPDSQRYATFTPKLLNSRLYGATAACAGSKCVASGGAIFAGKAFRGPTSPNANIPIIASENIVIIPLSIGIHSCDISRNLISSEYFDATLSGAGISFLICNATILNSSITSNTVQSSIRSTSFVGGAGVYVSGSKAVVILESTNIYSNNAGSYGTGGAIFAGEGAAMFCKNVTVRSNSAKNGGGIFVNEALVSLSESGVFNNSVTDSGGGLFCVGSGGNQGKLDLDKIILINTKFFDNFIIGKKPSAVGAAAFIFGNVALELLNGTLFLMNGDSQFTTVELVLSLSMRSTISSDLIVSCKGGSILSIADTNVEKQLVSLTAPTLQFQKDTQCVPQCLNVPKATPYIATSGFLASCIPCPRGTYSLEASSNSDDTVTNKCISCPFGAVCAGGFDVRPASSYWGWRVSEKALSSRFILLPSGYGCTEKCSLLLPCGGNRVGILCGACTADYSVAFFSIECVPSIQCASWKWGLLVLMCFMYQLTFSVWLHWSTESTLVQLQLNVISDGKRAVGKLSLFSNLSSDKIDKIVAKLKLLNIEAHTTVLTQGRPSEFMFIVKTGALNVFMFDDIGIESLKTRLAAHDVFGELSFITGADCASTVRTSEDCQLWMLDRSVLEDVAEQDKIGFIDVNRAKYSKVGTSAVAAFKTEDRDDYDAFGVLMWFYQLSGTMLSVTSPLSYLKGSSIAHSIVSFFVNAKPASDSVANLETKSTSTAMSSADIRTAEANTFQFCVSADFTVSQVYIASFVYYVLWALLMAILAQKRVWMFFRSAIFLTCLRLSFFLDKFREPEPFKKTFREQVLERQKVCVEIRGPVILKWFVTCFSAVSALMMQGTACYHLEGLGDAGGELRWIYDGRVACFSNDGDFPGQWQVASAVGVALALAAPAALWILMVRLLRMGKKKLSKFQESLLQEYLGAYSLNARHWMVLMCVPLF
jgi:hypothetical protein